MDHTNHWYGHAHILSEYCGFEHADPPPIRGKIQHGWTFVHGFGNKHTSDRSLANFVWSDQCRRRGQVIGWRDYWTIGAPYLYLMRLRPDPAPKREGTIWYPFHGTIEYETVGGSHRSLIEEIKDTEEGPVTVCLYYVEFDDPVTRGHYEDAGFRVICHGKRGAQWQGTDSNFLYRALAENRAHERVASNRLSTAIFYGVAAGCEPAVYGDPMEFEGGAAGFDGTDLLLEWYPMLHGAHLDVELAREITARELGTDFVQSPEELRIALGWQESWQRSSN